MTSSTAWDQRESRARGRFPSADGRSSVVPASSRVASRRAQPVTVARWLAVKSVYVQSYFRRLKGFSLFTVGETITIQLPIANIVMRTAVRKFARFRDYVVAQNRELIHDEDASGPLR